MNFPTNLIYLAYCAGNYTHVPPTHFYSHCRKIIIYRHHTLHGYVLLMNDPNGDMYFFINKDQSKLFVRPSYANPTQDTRLPLSTRTLFYKALSRHIPDLYKYLKAHVGTQNHKEVRICTL